MPLKVQVLHSSDLHGHYSDLLAFGQPFDVWLDTGDFFPNAASMGDPGFSVEAEVEREYQAIWMRGADDLAGRLAAWLAGRPALIMPGNHDYLGLAAALQMAGADAEEITPAGLEFLDLRWAGFRDVKWMDGHWNGESRDLSEVVAATFADEPDVLVTHAPPAVILESELGFGIAALTEALRTSERVTSHFFGHDHRCGGESAEAFGVRFYNGAKQVTLRTVPVPQRSEVSGSPPD